MCELIKCGYNRSLFLQTVPFGVPLVISEDVYDVRCLSSALCCSHGTWATDLRERRGHHHGDAMSEEPHQRWRPKRDILSIYEYITRGYTYINMHLHIFMYVYPRLMCFLGGAAFWGRRWWGRWERQRQRRRQKGTEGGQLSSAPWFDGAPYSGRERKTPDHCCTHTDNTLWWVEMSQANANYWEGMIGRRPPCEPVLAVRLAV